MKKVELWVACCEKGLIKGDTSLYGMEGYSKEDLETMLEDGAKAQALEEINIAEEASNFMQDGIYITSFTDKMAGIIEFISLHDPSISILVSFHDDKYVLRAK